MLAIVDYGMGNVRSIYNAFNLLGEEVCITDDKNTLSSAEAIIVPGVGAFSDGMKNLREKNLLEILEKEVIEKKKPYLGICLGLEFLAEKSLEGGSHTGFGWIKGTVIRLQPNTPSLRVPHIGWNDTMVLKKEGLFKEIQKPTFYFLHSYYLKVDESEKNIITSICDYGGNQITATLQKDNIYAVQFHPEKSQSTGIKLLKNFLDDIRK
ncbi:MAG: imidazole glycerol phosphate synthase subunit HisH [Thaumarchaeota archaeon]|nr:MAG: imidazole glycerol phosphate synthase subunit HisH [Nitrososphaerota archaeon]